MRHLILLPILLLTGCVTERIIERPVPIQPPSLCLTDCPVPDGAPETNGALLESWQAQREAIACFRARQQCIREMVTAPPAR